MSDEQQAAVQKLLGTDEAIDQEAQERLDECVQDAKLQEASSVNNAGPRAQIAYLFEKGVTAEELKDHLFD